MVEPGRYRAIATDGSDEIITIVIVGSRIDTTTLNERSSIQGLSEVFDGQGRQMTPAAGENTFKVVGQERAYRIVGPA